MKIEITYEQALERHPEETAKIIAAFRKSRSKHKTSDPSTWLWVYSYCVRVNSMSFSDLLSGKQSNELDRYTASIEDLVADQVSRTSTLLQAECGKMFAGEGVANPPEIADRARVRFEKDKKEYARFLALSNEERELEIRQHISDAHKAGITVFAVKR